MGDFNAKIGRDNRGYEEIMGQQDIQQADRDLPIDCSAPKKEEIRKAIKKLRNGEAAGPDGIPAEALKADMETMEEMLHPLFKKI
ncbi:hypothetical protein SKAU_G00113390 [Synaphobranchus kaupii]|uniref:Uncharacterized protein n=1 Tax=Synaphobranchus kaupii TaxID=118154 RepID=A0A9Q1J8J9_SYNKA|nr:hypothetical protein SKAU_G00113390 [Synaphobranchus kaupii]